MKEEILRILAQMKGEVGFYYKNLVTKETFAFHGEDAFEAASVIKIPIMIQIYRQIENGVLKEDELYQVKKEDKLPSCGALSYLHDGVEVTLKDLCTLMIILSDNTATNMLIKRVGMQSINDTMKQLGLSKTKLNRMLFDKNESARGIQNYISPCEIGLLLEKMYEGSLVSKEASSDMISILCNQRLNGKIPFYMPDDIKIAHKTGEDSGITHDVGIVYANEPFIVCFCSNKVEVPAFNRIIQEITRVLYINTV